MAAVNLLVVLDVDTLLLLHMFKVRVVRRYHEVYLLVACDF